MTGKTTVEQPQFSKKQAHWEFLRNAITASSGFQSWQLQNGVTPAESPEMLDQQVWHYLQQTLETLAN